MKLFNPFASYKDRVETKKRRKQTITRVLESYDYLINEYQLIQEKKSSLSKSQRDFVSLRIKHLISKGHIQVSAPK